MRQDENPQDHIEYLEASLEHHRTLLRNVCMTLDVHQEWDYFRLCSSFGDMWEWWEANREK